MKKKKKNGKKVYVCKECHQVLGFYSVYVLNGITLAKGSPRPEVGEGDTLEVKKIPCHPKGAKCPRLNRSA